MTNLDQAMKITDLKTKYENRKRSTLNEMRDLARRLEEYANELEQSDSEYFPLNPKGIVQASGSSIDVRCAELAGIVEAIKLISSNSEGRFYY